MKIAFKYRGFFHVTKRIGRDGGEILICFTLTLRATFS